MKNKITLITLIACAAAGTTFAADPVEAFRASSGTTTNSADKVYVGNDEWGADAKDLGERYFADLWMKYGDPENAGTRSFTWDPERKAFLVYTEIDEGDTMKEFMSYDFAFALTGTAQFTNAADTTMTFGFNGVPPTSGEFHDEEKNEWSYLDVGNEVLLAGSSKFTNAGTIRFKSTTLAGDPAHTGYEVFLRDDAVFENTGTIATEPDDNYISYIGLNLFGNSKFVNAEGGTMERAELTLHGNATFENAGTIVVRESSRYDTDYVTLHENAKFVNTGTIEGGAIYGFKFYPGITGTEKVENRGTMDRANVEFAFELNSASETLSGVSATFENHGTIKALDDRDGWGDMEILTDFEFWGEDDLSFDEYCGSFQRNLEKSDLNVKNYGTIDLGRNGTVAVVGSGVKLTLAEGSRIVGETVSIGVAKGRRSENGYESVRLDNDVLNIVLTGRGGNDPLISGDLDLCNRIELGVSFADDAVQLTKYEIKIWGGELKYGEYYFYSEEKRDLGFRESTLSGTLDRFGTTYDWRLDTKTGVLTARDVNIGEEITVSDKDASVSLGGKDVATLPPDLEEFYGTISGSGQVEVKGDLTFTGDMSEHTGTTNIGEKGTFTVTGTDVKLGTGTFSIAGTLKLDVQGTFVFEAKAEGSGALEISSGATVSFSKSVGVKTLNVSDGATLSGGVKLTHKEAVLNLAGTLALDATADEKVTLGGGKVVLAPTAKLDLGGNAASGAAQTQTLFANATNASSALEHGATVTIFENGTVEGDVVAFLRTDQTLAALAAESAVIYDATNGLSVQSLKNPSALTSYVDTSDLSSSFVGWALGGLEKELANLPHDFVSKDDLGGLDSTDPLLNALISGDAGTARSILDRLSPKSYAAMIAMPVETFHDDVRSIAARLEQRRHDAAAGVDGDWQFFAQAQMISVENDTASDAPTFDFDRYGALAGADVKLDETTLLGVAVGAGTGDADIHNGGGKIESTDFRALAYFGKTFAERFYVNAGAQLGFASYDVKRRSDYGDANADVDGWNAGAFAEAGAAFAISETHGLYATPYVGLAYAHAETDSFTESGSARAAFDADALEGDSLRARIGCAFSWDFALASTAVRLGLDVAYSRELLDDEIDVDVRSGSDEISETAAALPEDVFSIGPTLDVALTASASIYAGYAFNAGTDSSTAHSANVGFRMRF